MKKIVESTVNGILDRRLLNEAGGGGGLETDVAIQKTQNTYPGFVSADGSTVSGGIAGMAGDPSPVVNFTPPTLTRIDPFQLNRAFSDWFREYNKKKKEEMERARYEG
jgi:hypothetical protein